MLGDRLLLAAVVHLGYLAGRGMLPSFPLSDHPLYSDLFSHVCPGYFCAGNRRIPVAYLARSNASCCFVYTEIVRAVRECVIDE